MNRWTAVAACASAGAMLVPSPAGSIVVASTTSAVAEDGSLTNGRSQCRLAWRVVPTPATGDSDFTAVDARASSDVWAVGTREATVGKLLVFRPLIEHWNGRAWNVTAVPEIEAVLFGVDALSAREVWAVGQDVTMHLAGGRWNATRLTGIFLDAVAAVASDDVWAVGRTGYDLYDRSSVRIVHWNGRKWIGTPLQIAGELNAISAVTRNNIWAVGAKTIAGEDRALIVHWNGRSWKEYPAPPGTSWLNDVTAVGKDDVWASGNGAILHWNGRSWKRFAGPPGKLADRSWDALAATSSHNLWVAHYLEGVFHWNGARWRRAWGQHEDGVIEAMSALRPADVWAVGSQSQGRLDRPLVVHYSCV